MRIINTIVEAVQSADFQITCIWLAIAALLLVLFYLILCAIGQEHDREELELMREIRDALPWADPGKIIMDTEYAPVFLEERRKKY